MNKGTVRVEFWWTDTDTGKTEVLEKKDLGSENYLHNAVPKFPSAFLEQFIARLYAVM